MCYVNTKYPDPMVLVSHIYKFIYLKNHKVAGSSVEAFFGQFCVSPREKKTWSFEDKREEQITPCGIIGSRLVDINKTWYNHKPAREVKDELGELIFDRYFKFCVVRNPYEAVVSSYYWYKPNTDFKTYCNNCDHNIIDTDNVGRMLIDGKEVCQYYIRYENLIEDIKTVLNKLEITDYNINDLPKHKSGRKPEKSYREYYDEESKAAIYNKFKKEFEMFNYEF